MHPLKNSKIKEYSYLNPFQSVEEYEFQKKSSFEWTQNCFFKILTSLDLYAIS